MEPRTLYYFSGKDPLALRDMHDSVILCRAEAVDQHRADLSFLVIEADPQIVF
ncbi:MAG: hypothetical protein IPF41_16205 [Flavobacteriales bacterium]|nr:hypothetical protein [Flavobacteriales bacterium]